MNHTFGAQEGAAGGVGLARARPEEGRAAGADGPLFSSSRCPRDSTYQSFSRPSPRVARFKFSSFYFLRRFPSVYLQCQMVVCRADDAFSRCRRGCVVRSKRDVGSYQEKVDVVLGPIWLQAPRPEKRSLAKRRASRP